MIDIKELDKRLMFQDAWKHNTPYSTLLICNGATAHRLALTLGMDKLDNYKGCVAIRNSQIVELLQTDPLKRILDRNSLAYASWKVRNNKEHYESNKKNVLTIVWR